ncbi:MAG TPA: hypothetical protein VLZ11_07280 [Flavobacterium sp.]|nr:hypothetical protein [Flavobacterium sp.]
MKEKLRNIVEDNTTTQGKIFDYFIQVLILLSLIAFTIETFPKTLPKPFSCSAALNLYV